MPQGTALKGTAKPNEKQRHGNDDPAVVNKIAKPLGSERISGKLVSASNWHGIA
jgi:hypothetical protein